jgi:hypothetical protein
MATIGLLTFVSGEHFVMQGQVPSTMNRPTRPTRKDLERSRIERCLAALEDAVSHCRTEDIRYGRGISAALQFLEMQADEKWPFEQFRKALEDPGMDGTKPEARWQMLNASLNAIKRVIGR